MKNLFLKPHYFFLPASILLALLGFLVPMGLFDINYGDTYYVVEYKWAFHLMALMGLLVALVYWLMIKKEKPLSYRLNALHVSACALGPILIWIATWFYKTVLPNSDTRVADYAYNANVSMVIIALSLITLIVQLVFPMNLISALFRAGEKKED